jgi:peptidyl-prolyl cis-trans isomerase C
MTRLSSLVAACAAAVALLFSMGAAVPAAPSAGVEALTAIPAISAVADTGDTAATADVPFAIGEPVADSATALLLVYGNATRTIGVDAYQQAVRSMTRGQPIPDNQRTQLHRQVVLSFVVRMAASHAEEIQSIEVDPGEVNARYRQQANRFEDSTAFADALSQAGVTPDSLRSMITQSLRMDAYRDTVTQNLPAPPSDSVAAFAREQSTIGARHILLQTEPGASPETVDSLRSLAASLIDSVEAGADFARLARTYSDGPSGNRGGDLGTFQRERMVDPFADAAFSLDDSSDVYPEPVRTQYGFHVIQLTQDLTPMPTDEARDALMQEESQTVYREAMERLMQDVTVRLNPDIVPLAASDFARSDG